MYYQNEFFFNLHHFWKESIFKTNLLNLLLDFEWNELRSIKFSTGFRKEIFFVILLSIHRDFFCQLPHILFSMCFSHMESSFRRLTTSLEHLILESPFQSCHFSLYLLLLCNFFFETTQHKSVSSPSVQPNDYQNVHFFKISFLKLYKINYSLFRI